MAQAAPDEAAARPPRFGWPMRLFLGLLLCDIVFRSLAVLVPWDDWARQLDMRLLPAGLPTRAELDELAARATSDEPNPGGEEVMQALDSVWRFGQPWPREESRRRIRTAGDVGKFAVCWLGSRLAFAEALCGIDQEWPMFSPNVSRVKWVPRARLVFADGSDQLVRPLADPGDPTRYAHWGGKKLLGAELKAREGAAHADDCFGWCNLLAHRHPQSEAGAPLVRVVCFQVRYDLPPPGADARTFLAAQAGPPPEQVYPDFYEYDVAGRHGKCLEGR
jgi:hypothetical protein